MNFQDIGIIIAKKPLQENASVISIFTRLHGLYSGVTREYSNKSRFAHQAGSLVDFYWHARLDEHIGTIKCELVKSYVACFMNDKTKLYAFNSIISLVKVAFHEREANNSFFGILNQYLENLTKAFDFVEYIKVELEILSQAGYGLQLDTCAATNKPHDLRYVSPRSGRAVSGLVGAPFAERLLALPECLASASNKGPLSCETVKQAFDLTTYFLNRYFFHSVRQPQQREIFIDYMTSEDSEIYS